MNDSEILILVAIIAVIILIALKIYTFIKARHLREIGYTYIYYYMKNCGLLSYYREKARQLDEIYLLSYEELNRNKDKWYLSIGSKNVIKEMTEFFIQANKIGRAHV